MPVQTLVGIKPHTLGGDSHQASTLAQLNAKVSDADMDDSGDPRDPNAHTASHKHSGSDEVATATSAANAIPKANASGQLNGGWIDDTSHGNRGGGALHADVVAGGADGFMTGADKTKLDGLGPTTQVTSVTPFSTTSLTDVLITGMTITPGAGTYMVWFSGQVTGDGGAKNGFFSIYANGVKQAHSERVANDVKIQHGSTQALVTVAAAQTIEARGRGGDTLLVDERSLITMRVA